MDTELFIEITIQSKPVYAATYDCMSNASNSSLLVSATYASVAEYTTDNLASIDSTGVFPAFKVLYLVFPTMTSTQYC